MNINKSDFYKVMKAKAGVLSKKNLLDEIWEEFEVLAGKKKTFKIHTINAGPQEVKGIPVNDHFFLYQEHGGVSVSHIKTGAAAAWVRTMTIGKKLANILSDFGCWDFDDLEAYDRISPELKDKMRAVIMEYKMM